MALAETGRCDVIQVTTCRLTSLLAGSGSGWVDVDVTALVEDRGGAGVVGDVLGLQDFVAGAGGSGRRL